jgi:hypothetical protein
MTTYPQPDPTKARAIYVNGLAATAKLIEARIENDIAATETQLLAEETKPTQGKPGSLIERASSMLIESKRSRLFEQFVSKRVWLREWRAAVWQGIAEAGGDVDDLQGKPLDACIAACCQGPDGAFARFSLLQEAVLAPVYGEFDGLPKGLKEMDVEAQNRFVAGKAGLAPELGTTIYRDTDAFVKGAQDYWKKVVGFALFSGVTMAAVALVAAPAIAGAIGAAAGLSGAAAVSHGLALLGGGSLASGGFGMAGGMAVLTASGGVTSAAAAGGSAASFLRRLPTESVTISAAKVLNYVKYLDTVRTPSDSAAARKIREEEIAAFLATKHNLERDVLAGQVPADEAAKAADAIRVLHFAYGRLADQCATYRG